MRMGIMTPTGPQGHESVTGGPRAEVYVRQAPVPFRLCLEELCPMLLDLLQQIRKRAVVVTVEKELRSLLEGTARRNPVFPN